MLSPAPVSSPTPPITLGTIAAYVGQASELARRNAVTFPIEDQPKLFLDTVWQAMPGSQLVGIAVDDEYFKTKIGQWNNVVSTKWLWKDAINLDFYAWGLAHNKATYHLPGRGSVYWQAASRKDSVLNRFQARGALDELQLITSFFCDLDCAKRGYTLDRALDALLGMPLKPTIVLFTGAGLQAVHVLRDAWPVINKEAAQEYKSYSLAFYDDLYQRTGIQADRAVHEAARHMRLPGTMNRKEDRGSAMARIIYFNPTALYTPDEIKQHAPLPEVAPPTFNLFKPLGKAPDGTFQVGLDFINYLVDRQPQPPERHPVLLKLAFQAARAGISMDIFIERARPIAQLWYSEDTNRAGAEFDNLVLYAYTHVTEDDGPNGTWAIVITDEGFARASEEAQAKLNDKTVTVDPPTPVGPDQALSSPTLPVAIPLSVVRTEQLKEIKLYAEAKPTSGNGPTMGTYMLVRTPPGGGKTHAALQVAYEYSLKKGTGQGGRGKVAILTQFTIEEHSWREWLRNFGIHDSSRAMYIVGRNADQNSAGYCAMNTLADAVAAKGHNAVHMVCKRCPVATQCEQSWYLSQFKKAQKKDIVLARHQHSVVEQLIGYRRLLVFDESPLGVIGGAITLALKDLVINPPAFVYTQYAEQVNLMLDLINALRQIISNNTQPAGYPTEEHVKLGGHWLMVQLQDTLGTDKLEAILAIDPAPIQRVGQPGAFSLTVEDVAALPYNFLFDLWSILKYEYEKHYQVGRQRWNSRLIPWGQTLRVYPMQPFAFDPLTKIIVTDATGQPDLYGKAFVDARTSRPRESYIYEAELTPHAHITQWTDTGNSRRSFHYSKKAPIEINTVDGQQFSIEPEEDDVAAMVRAKDQIKLLAEKHHGSLLVVCYMKIHHDLMAWAMKNKVLKPEYIQYYGNLRGKNDFKHLEACLLIGEPRIPRLETFAAAQVWHWNDEIPVNFDLDTSALKQEQYPGYVAPDGMGRAYAYPGHKDERVNRMYVWAIQAEMRQCYERIRANAPEEDPATGKLKPKFVYIAAQMPCSDHVDELLHWSQWKVDEVGRAWFEAQIADGKVVTQAEYIESIRHECSWDTAQRSYLRVKKQFIEQGKTEEAMINRSQLQLAIDWLTDPAFPERKMMSARGAWRENSAIGLATWGRAKKIIGSDPRSASHLIYSIRREAEYHSRSNGITDTTQKNALDATDTEGNVPSVQKGA